ncbi:MAG: hypothetical protein QT11_C0001G0965 [archaeon GW2011_AR20]|nr:MAG: hypothetical protein QT11_C0001G0965 [archaeon GW2011_AR20]MBS3160186.1 hypothetical protein [Candidatus Woesearchaeota archaeon]
MARKRIGQKVRVYKDFKANVNGEDIIIKKGSIGIIRGLLLEYPYENSFVYQVEFPSCKNWDKIVFRVKYLEPVK